ncbi:MAG: PD40 domain-containing protein [Sedimentisphaerales bacterium]|nr:PD40 domain-containing protein [Sedimentisphaerales bacterium]
MRFQNNTVIFSAVLILVISSLAFSDWTEPVPLSEINTEFGEGWTFLSSDGMTLYFSRWETPAGHYAQLYMATRTTQIDYFPGVTQIDELTYTGGHVRSAWVSPDNLRMYFLRTEPGAIRRIKVSKRESVSSPWEEPQNLTEINNLGNVDNPKLSSDELTIVFNVYLNKSDSLLCQATRSDRYLPFTNIREISELNTSNEKAVYLSLDGLTLYFARNDDGASHNYMSKRPSINSYFGTPQLLNYWPEKFGLGCFSPDGKTAYLLKNDETTAEPGNHTDIYVSHYIFDDRYYFDIVKSTNSNNGMSTQTTFAAFPKADDTIPQ